MVLYLFRWGNTEPLPWHWLLVTDVELGGDLAVRISSAA